MIELARRLVGLDSPFGAFAADDPAGRWLLLLRVVALGACAWAAFAGADARGRRLLAFAGALFVGSLAARVLLVPFVVVALAGAARRRASMLFAGGACAAALLGAAVVASRATGGGEGQGDDPFVARGGPAAEAIRRDEADNPFWARYWALRWAASEPDDQPGRGHLALARADLQTGHVDEARRIAEALAQRAPDPAVRAEALDALQSFPREAPP